MVLFESFLNVLIRIREQLDEWIVSSEQTVNGRDQRMCEVYVNTV